MVHLSGRGGEGRGERGGGTQGIAPAVLGQGEAKGLGLGRPGDYAHNRLVQASRWRQRGIDTPSTRRPRGDPHIRRSSKRIHMDTEVVAVSSHADLLA